MPTIRVKGWPPGRAPSEMPAALTRVFYDATDLDDDQIAAAFKRLKKGKVYAVPFDPGGEEPARRMMEKLEALGLKTELRGDDVPARDDEEDGEAGRRSILSGSTEVCSSLSPSSRSRGSDSCCS